MAKKIISTKKDSKIFIDNIFHSKKPNNNLIKAFEKYKNFIKNETFNFDELWNRLPEDIKLEMINSEQDPIWHPEGSVYNHIKLVFEYALKNYPKDKELLLCAIFHDLGKPETKEIRKDKNGKIRISNHGHEYKSVKYIDKYFHLYSDVSNNKEKVLEICINHMKAHLYLDYQLKKPNKRKNFEELKYFNEIINFTHCDTNKK
jgi:putative nucleotidyltransferase with HDIG domain